MADLSKLSEDEMIFVADLLREVEKVPYGDINFTVTKFKGRVANVVSSEFRKQRYGEGSNHIAVAELIAMVKNMLEREQNGQLSFTILFNKGQIKEVINQFHNKKIY